jgi:DNA-binding NtrC family response regulator
VRPTRRAASVPERRPIAACGERFLELLELEHATLPALVDASRDDEATLRIRRAQAGGSPIREGVPSRFLAALLLQAAAAAAFFGSRGFPLGPADWEDARWEPGGDSARLWIPRTPASSSDAAPPAAEALDAILRLLCAGGSRLRGAARALRDALEAPGATLRRGEHWVATVLRSFPGLSLPAAREARQRCLGIGDAALAAPRARALVEKTRGLVAGRDVRVFEPGGSELSPGGALRLEPPASSLSEACRRLRALAEDGRADGILWIAVEPERWDALSRRAFESARLALAGRVEAVVVGGQAPLPSTPGGWRRALWAPCGSAAASVRFYEWFASRSPSDAGAARQRIQGALASPGWAAFVSDPTGDAPLPEPGPPPASPPARGGRSAASEDPARRVERLVAEGRTAEAFREAGRWVAAHPDRPVEAWFALAARLVSSASGCPLPAWLEAIEAEREIAGGRPAEARDRLDRLARSASATVSERRRAALRSAEALALAGIPGEAGRRAAAWRRAHAAAPPGESVRALRLGALGFSREGRVDCALTLLDEADRVGAGLPLPDRVETALTRARVLALAGRPEEEARIYATLRPAVLSSGDERLAARFLAQEARGFLDRREHARAIVRLEQAIEIARDDPSERCELLLDLSAAIYHSGDPKRCRAVLSEAFSSAAAAGREDVARIARGNRVELLVNEGAWDEAAAEIAALESAARAERDDLRRLVALHHRGRLALRRGLLESAARDNAEARTLAAALGDRLEVGELALEEGDRLVYERDLEGARRAFEQAASGGADRSERESIARARLAELAWASDGGPPAETLRELEGLLSRDPYAAAETVARWRCLFGTSSPPPELCERAERILRQSGGAVLADRVFGSRPAAVPPESLREIRGAVCEALGGETVAAPAALGSLGIEGLWVRDRDGRPIARIGGLLPENHVPWRPLEAGGARYAMALWPQPPEDVAAPIGLLLETLLFRAAAEPAPTGFAEGWRRVGVVTADPSMEEPYRRLTRLAPQAVTVLVLGESGSGKEAVARALHRLSARAAGPFVAVNVPAIPEALLESELFGHARGAFSGADRERRGLLEEASGGTIFFDEIGDLAAPLQSKLLRALQEKEIRRVGENRPRPFDARVISATSRDLGREVEAGRFREDLYYRLHVALLRLPALRERGKDALLLARHFLERYAREYGRGALALAPDAAAAIAMHPWPGNVRELQNAMAQAAALCDPGGTVGLALLPGEVSGSSRPRDGGARDYRARVDAHRRDLIADALDRAGGNRSRAARDLGLSRQALHYLIKELNVTTRPPRS